MCVCVCGRVCGDEGRVERHLGSLCLQHTAPSFPHGSPLPFLSHPPFLHPLQYKVVTVAVLSEKFKIGGSLARRFIAEQVTAGKLRVVSASSNMGVYSRVE